MMPTRRSAFSGEMIQMPDPQKTATLLADQLALLLATETARREAAEARCAELVSRLIEADQRTERVTADLERAHGRIQSIAEVPAPMPFPTLQFPEPPPPVGYEVIVTARDVDGKIKKAELIPK